jgi:hypothetical protein
VSAFGEVCELLAGVLHGSRRRDIVASAASAGDLAAALHRLRDGMRTHTWKGGGDDLDLARAIQRYDRKTRQLGFHVLNDWDGIADNVNPDIIPVDVLHYLAERRGSEPASGVRLAILLDYYFMHLLALLTLRVWDEGDADANLGQVQALLEALQGPDGSGQRFADDAETLLLIATSHYELHERGYGVLLANARTLGREARVRIALGHAASMGCHLRFGFEATYGRDTINMRDDNVADYPWLCFALATLMDEYERLDAEPDGAAARAPIVEALLNGLSGDARAFVGAPPASLAACESERAAFSSAFRRFREPLLAAFDAYRPADTTYSPLSFFFNFSHNVVKGIVIDALLRGEAWQVSLNDLLRSESAGRRDGAARIAAAEMLMGYARTNPHRIRGRLRPVIVYDVASGREAFSVALRKLKE